MKIVLLDGALFNQITQYVFARCLEIETGEEVLLDDSFFHIPTGIPEKILDNEKTGYHLRKLKNAKPHLLSEYFTPDVWEEMLTIARSKPKLMAGSHMPQILKDLGLDFFMIAEPKTYKFDGHVARMPYYQHIKEMLYAQGNVYYWGYFTHGDWFMDHEELFRNELEFPPFSSENDIKMAEQISQCFSICIHLRRGSFELLNITVPSEYYNMTIKLVYEKFQVQNPHFFVFSDDIQYCHDHASELGLDIIQDCVTYGQATRTAEDNQCDSQLMSLCKGMILSNSVYSYYSALLNTNPDKFVINPTPKRGVFKTLPWDNLNFD